MTKKQKILQDERVLAAILAGAAACGRPVLPSCSHDGVAGSFNHFGVDTFKKPFSRVRAACCAVGVGLLYRGVRRTARPISEFARRYGVSRVYAEAVSDGFEYSDYQFAYEADDGDRWRGLAVGRAAFEALCVPEAP